MELGLYLFFISTMCVNRVHGEFNVANGRKKTGEQFWFKNFRPRRWKCKGLHCTESNFGKTLLNRGKIPIFSGKTFSKKRRKFFSNEGSRKFLNVSQTCSDSACSNQYNLDIQEVFNRFSADADNFDASDNTKNQEGQYQNSSIIEGLNGIAAQSDFSVEKLEVISKLQEIEDEDNIDVFMKLDVTRRRRDAIGLNPFKIFGAGLSKCFGYHCFQNHIAKKKREIPRTEKYKIHTKSKCEAEVQVQNCFDSQCVQSNYGDIRLHSLFGGDVGAAGISNDCRLIEGIGGTCRKKKSDSDNTENKIVDSPERLANAVDCNGGHCVQISFTNKLEKREDDKNRGNDATIETIDIKDNTRDEKIGRKAKSLPFLQRRNLNLNPFGGIFLFPFNTGYADFGMRSFSSPSIAWSALGTVTPSAFQATSTTISPTTTTSQSTVSESTLSNHQMISQPEVSPQVHILQCSGPSSSSCTNNVCTIQCAGEDAHQIKLECSSNSIAVKSSAGRNEVSCAYVTAY